jgi:hypothetical protein
VHPKKPKNKFHANPSSGPRWYMRLADRRTDRATRLRSKTGFQWRFNDPGNGKRYLGPQVVPDITKSGSSQQIFMEVPKTKSNGNPSIGSRADTRGRRTRPTYALFPATRTRFKEPQRETNTSNTFSSLLQWHNLDNTTEQKKITNSLLIALHRRAHRHTHTHPKWWWGMGFTQTKTAWAELIW